MTNAKRFSAVLAVFIPLCFVITALLSLPALADARSASAVIQVTAQLTGDAPSGEETFTFVLEPEDSGAPMPSGVQAGRITISGGGTASFGAITFSEPGTYTYTLTEEKGSAANYTYDGTVYRVSVYVISDDGGDLTADIGIVSDKTGNKTASAVFSNSYRAPADTGRPGESPKTGDDSRPGLWIGAAAASVLALTAVLWDPQDRKRNPTL